MILYIDTTDYNSATFAVVKNSKVIKKSYKTDPHKVYETLQKLDEFLKSKKLKVESIRKIVVNKGPGSFTGTRVGIAYALALKLALKIPVTFLFKNKFKI